MTTLSACPAEQQVAAFVDGTLPAEERASLEQHLDRCETCFDLAATLGLLASQAAPKVSDELREAALRTNATPRWIKRALPAMSVAAALLLAVVWWKGPAHATDVASSATPGVTQATPVSPVRSVGSDNEVTLEEPRDGDVVRTHPQVRWKGPADAVTYEVQVTTSSGDVLWTRQVDGTLRTLRLDTPLPAGQVCYVWVAAYLPEGRRIASNVVKFQVDR